MCLYTVHVVSIMVFTGGFKTLWYLQTECGNKFRNLISLLFTKLFCVVVFSKRETILAGSALSFNVRELHNHRREV
jgi:hypothetical protein